MRNDSFSDTVNIWLTRSYVDSITRSGKHDRVQHQIEEKYSLPGDMREGFCHSACYLGSYDNSRINPANIKIKT